MNRSHRRCSPRVPLPALIVTLTSLVTTFSCLTGNANAAVLHVPDPWPTLQLALDATFPGDTILVAPGTYTGNFLWPDRRGISLLSEAGAAATTLDGGQVETVLALYFAAIDSTTVIRGFTITNGKVEGS